MYTTYRPVTYAVFYDGTSYVVQCNHGSEQTIFTATDYDEACSIGRQWATELNTRILEESFE